MRSMNLQQYKKLKQPKLTLDLKKDEPKAEAPRELSKWDKLKQLFRRK